MHASMNTRWNYIQYEDICHEIPTYTQLITTVYPVYLLIKEPRTVSGTCMTLGADSSTSN